MDLCWVKGRAWLFLKSESTLCTEPRILTPFTQMRHQRMVEEFVG